MKLLKLFKTRPFLTGAVTGFDIVIGMYWMASTLGNTPIYLLTLLLLIALGLAHLGDSADRSLVDRRKTYYAMADFIFASVVYFLILQAGAGILYIFNLLQVELNILMAALVSLSIVGAISEA
jgi:hypothetical protein